MFTRAEIVEAIFRLTGLFHNGMDAAIDDDIEIVAGIVELQRDRVAGETAFEIDRRPLVSPARGVL